MPILSLIPPGGFSNQVGHHVAAMDIALDAIKEAARRAADAPAACALLRDVGELERTWIHEAVGQVPTPPAPEGDDVDGWLGWLDAVRTVSVMVLRPMQDRDLERVVRLPGEDGDPRTLKRLLAELLFQLGDRHARLDALQGAASA
jgi:hypothetical protein